jgi:hypothetical protein
MGTAYESLHVVTPYKIGITIVPFPGVLFYRPDRPRTHNPPASAFPVLGLQVCTTTADLKVVF